jgi:hypothetical protein
MIALHGREQRDHLVLQRVADADAVERDIEVLGQRVEVRVADRQFRVRRAHVAAVVDAGPAGQLAQLRIEQVLEPRQLGLREHEVDALVREHDDDQLVDSCLELRLAAHAEEQRLLGVC